jgi:hypothetical protein
MQTSVEASLVLLAEFNVAKSQGTGFYLII